MVGRYRGSSNHNGGADRSWGSRLGICDFLNLGLTIWDYPHCERAIVVGPVAIAAVSGAAQCGEIHYAGAVRAVWLRVPLVKVWSVTKVAR